MDALLAGIQWISNWIGGDAAGNGIGGLLRQFAGWAFQKLTVWYLELKIEGLKFGWSIAKGVLSDLHVTQNINNSLTLLPADVRAALNFFRVPECLTNIITAGVTRLVMRLTPGL